MNILIIASLRMSSMSASAAPLPSSTARHFADSTLIGVKTDYNKYIHAVDRKSQQVQKLVDRRSEKVINRMLKLEHRIKSRLASKDSTSAAQLFNGPIQSLQALKAGLKSKLPSSLPMGNNYLDSVSSTLTFLGAQNKLTSHLHSIDITAVKAMENGGNVLSIASTSGHEINEAMNVQIQGGQKKKPIYEVL